ncbi:hypothetical protein WN48_07873 [Eufriesea mexicana]|nr:hypothetical protein WN48_07873 [Eufriesea mexicana]
MPCFVTHLNDSFRHALHPLPLSAFIDSRAVGELVTYVVSIRGSASLIALGTIAYTTTVWTLRSDIAYLAYSQTLCDDSLIGFSPMWQGNSVTGRKATLGTPRLLLGVSLVRRLPSSAKHSLKSICYYLHDDQRSEDVDSDIPPTILREDLNGHQSDKQPNQGLFKTSQSPLLAAWQPLRRRRIDPSYRDTGATPAIADAATTTSPKRRCSSAHAAAPALHQRSSTRGTSPLYNTSDDPNK